jgi:hypothetical protein
LIERDDSYFGAPKPRKRGRGAAGRAKVVVAVETPADKPIFAAMHLVPRVSREEIQLLVQERLATEALIKPDGQSQTSAPLPGGILLPFQPPLLGTANV